MFFDVNFPSFLSFSRPFFRLARLAKLAGHNAKDGLTSHGFMGFGNDSSDKNDPSMAACALGSDNEMGMAGPMGGPGSGGATKFDKAAAMAAGRKWGNIVQVSISFFIHNVYKN